MFKIYSKGCEYALRILTQFPESDVGQKFTAVDLCRKAKVPTHSARKVLQLLVEHKYLEAVSGPGGGYRFKKSPDQINLLEIIQCIDGRDVFEKCVMGLPQCGLHNPCPIHHIWKNVKVDMKKEMHQKTLSELINIKKAHKK